MKSTVPVVNPVAADFSRNVLHAVRLMLGCLIMGGGAAILLRSVKALEVAAIIGLFMAGMILVGRVGLDAAVELAEELSRRDINNDGQIGGDRIIFVNKPAAPASRERFNEFIRAARVSTTEEHLLKTFTDDEITAYRDALITAGWATWNSTSHTHGWTLRKGATPDSVIIPLPEPVSE